MADEQAEEQIETPESKEETPETEEQSEEESETSEKTDDGEAENTQDKSGKGDLSIALKQEREKRQALEKALQNPQFVYEQARRLGLTEEQAQQAAEDAASGETPSPKGEDFRKVIADELDYRDAIKTYPDLAKDPEMLAWAGTKMQINPRLSYSQAFAEIAKTLGTQKESGKVEGAAKAKQEVSDKLKAQTVSGASSTPASEVDEDEELAQKAKSINPQEQMDAMTKIMMKKNKKFGI